MKKWKFIVIAGMMLAATGCSQKTDGADVTEMAVIETAASAEMETEIEIEAETEMETETTAVPAKEETKTEPDAAKEAEADTQGPALPMDNFEVKTEDAEAFALSVKEIVVAKDMEKLAELLAFPLYVGFEDGGVSVSDKEEFLALGAEKIFTEELLDAVAQTDEKALSPSRAGFVMSKESGGPNVVFGLRDGALAISGINY